MRRQIPWQIKIGAKLVLSRLPIPYRTWARLGLFKHGNMTSTDQALKTFNMHMAVADRLDVPREGVYVEMGTGDAVSAAVLLAARGVTASYLVDVGAYATRDLATYRALADRLPDIGLQPLDLSSPDLTFDDLLERCRSRYLTDGLASLRTIPDASVDFLWSHSTVEHIRKRDFGETMRETYRVMKPGGVVSHNIDLQDHLGHSLNNLRLTDEIWEKDWFAESGFYTNRIRYGEILAALKEQGFQIEETHRGCWESIPIPREKMASPFKAMPDEDLLVRTMGVAARKPHTG